MGYCAICHRYTELTKEHIPPQSYYVKDSNESKKTVEESTFLFTKNSQGYFSAKEYPDFNGRFVYSLCQRCNNDTGYYNVEFKNLMQQIILSINNKNYKIINHYNDISDKTINNISSTSATSKTAAKRFNVPDVYCFNNLNINILKLLKSVISMFCSGLNDCNAKDEESYNIDYKRFLLNKMNSNLSYKYYFFIYIDVSHPELTPSDINKKINGFFYFDYPLGFRIIEKDKLNSKDKKNLKKLIITSKKRGTIKKCRSKNLKDYNYNTKYGLFLNPLFYEYYNENLNNKNSVFKKIEISSYIDICNPNKPSIIEICPNNIFFRSLNKDKIVISDIYLKGLTYIAKIKHLKKRCEEENKYEYKEDCLELDKEANETIKFISSKEKQNHEIS